MLHFAQTCDAIAATTKKLEKTAIVGAYLRSLPLDEAATAAIFLSGRPFPAYEETTLQVGGSLLWRAIAELSGKSEHELTVIYRKYGDAGSVAAEALPERKGSSLSLTEVQQSFSGIATARGPSAKAFLLRQLLERATPLEAKYIVKIISGDLRIGLKESLVEEAIARGFEVPLDQVKRANMLLGDLGESLRLASAGKLADARLRLFHPIDFMLASPVESSEEALSYFQNASVEDKYDGIRAQAHISQGEVRIFSRTRDEITESFPELPGALAGLPKDAILDGEIVAWSGSAGAPARDESAKQALARGRALPFSTLQQRLGRKKVSAKLMHDVPVAYMVFDALYADGELLLDRSLYERAKILDKLMMSLEPSTAHVGTDAFVRPAERSSAAHASSQALFAFATPELPLAQVLRTPVATASSPEDLETLFTSARDRGNEGLMIKDLDSLYTPGRRGKSWLKMKRELATLDVVVTAVEYGHGKRIGVLSDYTFAVWDGDRLVDIGKAYSGLTDAEIAEMTEWFLTHKTSEQRLRLEVEPKIVLEVAFNNMMRSTRHESGYALRFPRIVRLRPDKLPGDADTIETAREIYDRQRH
ncbi:MAG: ATP-dependent DNA ligase [Acidobacteriia bacterium]|nr:ATP-dependent DNA ligase [Terriglobia bacterium]